jgi:hypothetical protein
VSSLQFMAMNNRYLIPLLLGATHSPARERTTIGEIMLNTTKVLPPIFQTFPRRQRFPTNAILFHILILSNVVNTTRSIPSLYPRRVIPTIPLPPLPRLILLYAPVPSSHLVPLASLPDVVRTSETLLPARHLPKPWLSLVLTDSCRLGIVVR